MSTFPKSRRSVIKSLPMKKSSKKRQAGQAAVEFALTIVFLMLFLLSFIEVTALLTPTACWPIPPRKGCATEWCTAPRVPPATVLA